LFNDARDLPMRRGVFSWRRVTIGVELKVGAISALFVVLIGAGALLGRFASERGRDDARIINLAGRQRTLSQKITQQAFALMRGEDVKEDLQRNVTQFDETLVALLEGDARNHIAAIRDEQARGRLDQALIDWKQFRPHVDMVIQGDRYPGLLGELLAQNEDLVTKLEAAVRAVEQSKVDGKPPLLAAVAALPPQVQKLNKELLTQLGSASSPTTAAADILTQLDRTLAGLLSVEKAPGRPPIRDSQVRQSLEAARNAWEPLRPRAQALLQMVPRLRQSLREVAARHERLLESVNDGVSYIEMAGHTRQEQLQSYQRLILLLGFLVALGGVAVTRLLIVRPVARSAHNLAVSSAQILAASQELETEAKDQVEALEDVTRTVQSLTESATRISESAEGVRENAERSRQTTDLTVKRFEELSTRTTRVAELLETIRHIAERSDLLALNASLEGSRAGEAGRAFSLVAKEIRRLAEAVGASVVDVKKLVTDIRESGASTLQATDEARKLAQSTAEASAEISMTTQRQRNATIQLAESMQAISAVLSRSTVSTRQTRAAAQDLKRQAERLNAVVARVQSARVSS
jgi:methyl-accepting chemotaxis protein